MITLLSTSMTKSGNISMITFGGISITTHTGTQACINIININY